jgi:DNA-binding transcriptional LysR family regulator
MRYFVAVAEEMHFCRAAERLHVSQPSLSLQIKQLEEQLNVKLFERSNRHVEITEAGRRLLYSSRKILAGIEEAVQETKDVSAGTAGTLRISYISTALVGTLPRVLRSLLSIWPDVDIDAEEINPEEQIEHLLNGNVDVAFIHGTVNDPRLLSFVVQSDHLIAALPEARAPEGAVNLALFSDVPTIMPAAFSSFGFSQHVCEAYELAGVVPCKRIHVKLLLSGLYLVASGIGLSLVPECFGHIQVKGVVYRPLALAPSPIELLAVYRRDSTSKLVKQFLQVLHADCALKTAQELSLVGVDRI